MKHIRNKKNIVSVFLTFALAIAMMAGFPVVKVSAASGAVYTCSITPCYAHPVTGEIEDSGGEASYATGQGMVEGAIYTTGIMEVTDSGSYYLTIRMSLMDYTSNHSFWVQNVGDSGWSTPSEIGITGNGTDSNGTTADICMIVPSENCIVRGAMYVEPMGRDVVFYLYPSNYSSGNSTDMNATIVTPDSGGSSESSSSGNTSSGSTSGGSSSAGTSLSESGNEESEAGETSEVSEAAETSENDGASEVSETEETVNLSGLENSITDIEPAQAEPDTDSELNKAAGLSLSTAGENEDTQETAGVQGTSPIALVIVITVAVLLVMVTAAGLVYFFRRNWKRWGGGEDDEE